MQVKINWFSHIAMASAQYMYVSGPLYIKLSLEAEPLRILNSNCEFLLQNFLVAIVRQNQLVEARVSSRKPSKQCTTSCR